MATKEQILEIISGSRGTKEPFVRMCNKSDVDVRESDSWDEISNTVMASRKITKDDVEFFAMKYCKEKMLSYERETEETITIQRKIKEKGTSVERTESESSVQSRGSINYQRGRMFEENLEPLLILAGFDVIRWPHAAGGEIADFALTDPDTKARVAISAKYLGTGKTIDLDAVSKIHSASVRWGYNHAVILTNAEMEDLTPNVRATAADDGIRIYNYDSLRQAITESGQHARERLKRELFATPVKTFAGSVTTQVEVSRNDESLSTHRIASVMIPYPSLPISLGIEEAKGALRATQKESISFESCSLVAVPYVFVDYSVNWKAKNGKEVVKAFDERRQVVINAVTGKILSSEGSSTSTISQSLTGAFKKIARISNPLDEVVFDQLSKRFAQATIGLTIPKKDEYRIEVQDPMNEAALNSAVSQVLGDKYATDVGGFLSSKKLTPSEKDISIHKKEVVHVPMWTLTYQKADKITKQFIIACANSFAFGNAMPGS